MLHFLSCGCSSCRPSCGRCGFRAGLARALAAAATVLALSLPLYSTEERRSPYGEAGSWYYTGSLEVRRVAVCEKAAASGCEEGWAAFGGSCYKSTAKSTYADAVESCERLGAALVSIGSEAENAFVAGAAGLCPEGDFCLIGLRGGYAGEGHAWQSGEPVTYSRLVTANEPLLPLFPLSRGSEYRAGILNNLQEEVSGCSANLVSLFDQVEWPIGFALLPGFALIVSGGLLICPRPRQQRFSTWLLWFSFTKNLLGFISRVWLMCYEDEFASFISINATALALETVMHSVAALLVVWLIIKRVGMSHPTRALRTMFYAVVTLMVLGCVNTSLFIDNSATLRPSAPVLLQVAISVAVTILFLVLSGLIGAHLYRAWSFLHREAKAGLGGQSAAGLAGGGVRAARLHFLGAVAASGSSALRLAAALGLALARMLGHHPGWLYAAACALAFLDTVTNDACAQLLAVLRADGAAACAARVSPEDAARARREVAEHRLAVRQLRAAPTAAERLEELKRLEAQARASVDTDRERQDFAALKASARAEAARIHKLMQCVRTRSMMMPLRYQYLLDVPALEGLPRQHVPEKFCGEESDDAASAYFEWLYAEAAGAERIFFNRLKHLLARFNRTPWSSDLRLASRDFPWTTWPAGAEEVAPRPLAKGEGISPGDILTHCPAKEGSARGCRAPSGSGGAAALCVVLEEVSASRVRIHRSGAVSPEEVARDELRTCTGGAVFLPGPLKKRQRCLAKVEADYEEVEPWPAAASLVDICRCRILLDDPYALAVLVAYVCSRLDVVRLRNRFADDGLDACDPAELEAMFREAAASGPEGPAEGKASDPRARCSSDYQYRDIALNVAIPTRSGVPLICEVQLTLSHLAVLRQAEQPLCALRRLRSPAELLKSHVFDVEG